MRSTAPAVPVRHEIVLAGGGHSHVSVIRHFGMRPLPGVRITVVSRDVHTPYSGMLPGLVAGHYAFDDCHIDLRALCQANGARLLHGTVTGLDRVARRVHIAGRAPLGYDWLSLNTGSCPALDSVAGAAEHGIAVKPIDRFLARWQAVLADLARAPRAFRIVVVGGGAAGVEVALACDHALRGAAGVDAARCRITLLSASAELLPTHNARVRSFFRRRLAERGIALGLGAAVRAADAGGLVKEDGSRVEAELIVWALHAGAPAWPHAAGLACDAQGFVRVDDHLRVLGEERIFAAGDLAALPVPVAKSGVYAVREGMVLARNLQRAAGGEALLRYRPQPRFLALLTTGGRHAVVSRGPLFASGDWVWRWKNRIDQRFMAMFRVAGAAPPAAGEEPAMRCGGCAAKLGADALGAALNTLAPQEAADVELGLAGADDAAVIAPPPGQRLVQSVDYFRAFLDDPWLLGRIAAVHALGDLHAMGARPHSALAIASVPHAAPEVMQETLAQLMQGALATLADEGVALLGGHSNEGAELAFGLSVNGFADPGAVLRKGGLQAGDVLILTKPLGTGVLLAANMGAAAAGRWIESAVDCMQQSNRAAVPVLRAHGVRACTDVTGFGLLGHLLEMLRHGTPGVLLNSRALPVLPGARECIARGWRSSLAQSNAAALARLDGASAADAMVSSLITDPQTAGGLLAAVPGERADECVRALREAGYPAAAIIGRCVEELAAGSVRLG